MMEVALRQVGISACLRNRLYMSAKTSDSSDDKHDGLWIKTVLIYTSEVIT